MKLNGEARRGLRRMLRICLASAVFVSTSLSGSGCKAEQWPLWESYSAKFLDGQGRVIDHGAGDKTTTEGEAYAMFFALVANDRPRFAKLVAWTEANLAGGDLTLRLPAWSWGKAADGSWRVLDPNSAADADLWMAYALSEAGRLWGMDRYAQLGTLMADRVAKQELALVPELGTTILPGANGFHPEPTTWYLNPSYLPPMLLAYFAHHGPKAPWNEVLDSLPGLTTSDGGFVMDWLRDENGTLRASPPPAAAQDSKDPPVAVGSYDAIRVYLWYGLADSRTHGVKEELDRMRAMALYLGGHTTPPLAVDATGKILNADAPAGFSAALIPYLHALNLKDLEKVQTARVLATKDASTGLYGHNGDYYDQNLVLFATGWTEQRYRFESDGRLHVAWK